MNIKNKKNKRQVIYMKRFKCTVTRVDEYIIEFDENKINEKWMKEFRDEFYDFNDLREHAEHIAQLRARFGSSFLEGYGYVLVDNKVPLMATDKDIIEDGINIQIVSEDVDCKIKVKKLNERRIFLKLIFWLGLIGGGLWLFKYFGVF